MTHAETDQVQARTDCKAGTKTTAAPVYPVYVVYNGVTQQLEAERYQPVQALLERALNAFGIRDQRGTFPLMRIRDQRGTFALIRQDGSEVAPATMSVAEANITEDTVLALRPRVVRGG
jgi:hypothetical protein